MAFAPDGRTIASAGGFYHGVDAAEVKIWDAFTGQETQTLKGHTSLVTAVAFFNGGRRLATASDDRTIKLWDVCTSDNVFTLRGHTSGVLSLAISGDDQLIVSGSIDHSAKTWSVASEPEVIAMEVSLRRSAVERVQSLYEKHMLKSHVIEALGSDTTLSTRVQRAALEIAERRTENASRLYEAGLLSVVRPGGRPDDYRLAVERLEAACCVIDDDLQRMSQYRLALALAYYRTGQAKKALETIDFNARGVQPDSSPVALVVTALAQKQLGRTNEATAALAMLRKLVATKWASNQEACMFLSEAEEMIEKPAKRAPDAHGL